MHRSIYIVAAMAGILCVGFLSLLQQQALAHCEVPCGIYDDHARVHQMLEDTTTVTKATAQILELSGKTDAQSLNQATRWVMSKEEHATRIQHTISQYFLTQRVKPKEMGTDGWNDYVMQLTEHHAVMVAAMKCKQTVDPDACASLKAAIERIGKYYPAPAHTHGG